MIPKNRFLLTEAYCSYQEKVPNVHFSRGSYGEVTLCSREKIAIKKFTRDEKISFDFVKEIGVGKFLQGMCSIPEILNIDPKNTTITTRLGKQVESPDKFPPERQRKYMFDILKCLAIAAEQGIIHCDIKPENIICDDNGNTMVIDWGVCEIEHSHKFPRPKNVYVQSYPYRSPEILLKMTDYTYKIDIFVAGFLFLGLYTGKNIIPAGEEGYEDISFMRTCMRRLLDIPREKFAKRENIVEEFRTLYQGPSVSEIIRKRILNDPYFFSNKKIPMSEVQADLVSKMLEFNPEHRIVYREILEHPYFSEFPTSFPERKIVSPLFSRFPSMNKVWGKFPRGEAIGRIHLTVGIYTLRPETFSLAIELLDLFSTRKKIEIETGGFYIVACIMIADKFYGDSLLMGDIALPGNYEKCMNAFCDVVTTLEGNIFFHTLGAIFMKNTQSAEIDMRKLQKIYLADNVYSFPMDKYL